MVGSRRDELRCLCNVDEDNLYLAADVTTTSSFDVIDGLPLIVDNFMVYISTDPDLDPGRTAYDTRDFLPVLDHGQQLVGHRA